MTFQMSDNWFPLNFNKMKNGEKVSFILCTQCYHGIDSLKIIDKNYMTVASLDPESVSQIGAYWTMTGCRLNPLPSASPLRTWLSPLSAAISCGAGKGGLPPPAAATTMDPLYLPTANLVADNTISTLLCARLVCKSCFQSITVWRSWKSPRGNYFYRA